MTTTEAAPLDVFADVENLSVEELSTLQTRVLAEFDAADTAEDTERMTALADRLRSVRAEIAKRAEAEAAETEEEPAAAEETAVAAETTPEAAPVAEVVQEGLPVAAAASSTVAVPVENAPVVASAITTSRVFAGAEIPGYGAGHEFTSGEDFGKALAKRINTLRGLPGGSGEKVLVASIERDTPADRVLDSNDPKANWDKIQEVIHPDAITAAGGCCAPLVTRYDLFDCGGVTDRPVKDALAGFRADRGGIRFYRGPALADVNGALGFWTCADDEAADPEDSGTWKVCARIDCPPEETAELQAITLCLTFGVLQTRIFPEVAVANNKLALVAQARLGDSALLAQIKAGSTRLTDSGTPLGAIRDLLDSVERAHMYLEDRYRIKGSPMRAIFPAWLLHLLRGDLTKSEAYGRDLSSHFAISDDEIQGFFTSRNINPTWALDSSVPATNGGGFLGPITWTPGTASPPVTEVPGTLPAWPTTVQWALYPEGTWLFLDGGQLDLGIIRDSTLVRTNDYMTFSETFESAVNIGCESLWLTSTVDVSGKAQGPIAG